MRTEQLRPFVSVLVPVYNVEKYLRQCLDSLVGQTLRNIEIVCVNDGSTDSSPEILREYARRDARIVVVDKPNGGLPSARNAGLGAARGEYVGFVDADDYVDATMFARLYAEAKRCKADIVVCGAHAFPGVAPHWIRAALSPLRIVYTKRSIDALFDGRGARPFLWRDLVRRDLIEADRIRLDESIVVGEDQAFQFKIFPRAKRISFLPDKLYYYRWCRLGSIMNGAQVKDCKRRVQEHIKLVQHIAQSWNEMGVMQGNVARFLDWAIDFLYSDVLRLSASDRAPLCRKLIEVLIENGYFLHCASLSAAARQRFEEIGNLSRQSLPAPLLSIAVAATGSDALTRRCLGSILSQNPGCIEAAVCIRFGDTANLAVATDWMKKDGRVCIYIVEEGMSLAEQYNLLAHTVRGEYIAFLESDDCVASMAAVVRAVDRLQGDRKFDAVGFAEPGAWKERLQSADYKQFLYRTERIRAEELTFQNFSLWTGRVFFARYCVRHPSIAVENERLFTRGEKMRCAALSTNEARQVLYAAVWLLRVGRRFGLRKLVSNVSSRLDTENYAHLLTDISFRFTEDRETSAAVFRLLLQANALAGEREGNTLLLSLSRWIELRQRVVNELIQ